MPGVPGNGSPVEPPPVPTAEPPLPPPPDPPGPPGLGFVDEPPPPGAVSGDPKEVGFPTVYGA